MELKTMKDAFGQVVKKQKLSISKSREMIEQVGCEIEKALATIQSHNGPVSPVDQKSVLTELKTTLNTIGPNNQLGVSQKELQINLGKWQKVLEKTLNPDISKAYRTVDFDPHIMNHIIVSHFYHEGQFDIADCLINEACEPEAISLRLQFVELHEILEELKSCNLQPALNWVSANRERLRESGSTLELKLHAKQYVQILQNRSQSDAINYAKTYLAPFSPLHINEIQKLMCCLLWAEKLDRSPYYELMAPTHLEKLAEELMQHFCSFMGLSHMSPLNVAVAAGVEGLPTLLKLANVMAAKKQEWQAMKQLPVPVELGKEFQFHSVFVCPVSRDQCSEENPPMLLPCGHVLCRHSIHKLSKSSTRTFKCPYCPMDASTAHCRQLYF